MSVNTILVLYKFYYFIFLC